MRPLGYMYKQNVLRPDWIKAQGVTDILSLSGCISEFFADYIDYWKHNGYWLFDSPEIIEELARQHAISLEGMRLFYYEGYEREFDDSAERWIPYEPDSSFVTSVVECAKKKLEGFDVVCFSQNNSPECSPLSCNAYADLVPTNAHCLFSTFDDAFNAIDGGVFKNAEHGPYRIISVYSTDIV